MANNDDWWKDYDENSNNSNNDDNPFTPRDVQGDAKKFEPRVVLEHKLFDPTYKYFEKKAPYSKRKKQ